MGAFDPFGGFGGFVGSTDPTILDPNANPWPGYTPYPIPSPLPQTYPGYPIPGINIPIGPNVSSATVGYPGSSSSGSNSGGTSQQQQQGLSGILKSLGLSPNAINSILTLAGIGGQIGSTVLNSQNRAQALQLLQGLSNTYQNAIPGAQFAGQYAMGPAAASAQSVLNGQNPYMQLLSQSLIPNIGALNNVLPNIMGSNTATSQPATAAQLAQLQSAPQNYQGILNAANQIIGNGGQTAQSETAANMAQQYLQGQGSNLGSLLTSGNTLLGNQGQTPGTQALNQTGQNILGTQGMTPQLLSAINSAQQLVNNGGVNPMTSSLFNRGSQLSAQNPLLPMALAGGFAQDQAGQQFAQQAQNLRSQLAARGQGPGSVVANGAGNQALADLSGQAIPGISQALQNALVGQQGLQLQQTGLGLNTASGASGQSISNLANALGALSNLTNSGTNLLGTGGNLLGSGQSLALQGQQTGGNLLNQFNQASLGGGQLLNSILGTQNQQLGLGLNSGLGAAGGITQAQTEALQALLTGSGQGIQLGTNLGNLYLGNQGQLAGAINSGLGANQSAINSLNTQGNTYLDYATQLLRGLQGTTTSQTGILTTGSPWASFLNNLGGAIPPSLFNTNATGTTSNPATTGQQGSTTPNAGAASSPVSTGPTGTGPTETAPGGNFLPTTGTPNMGVGFNYTGTDTGQLTP